MNLLPACSSLIALAFCVSCNGAHEIEGPSKETIKGRYYQNKPIGEWTYYDETKHAIKQISYFDSTGSNYEARYYAQGKLVYLERIHNHLLLYQEPQVNGIEQGRMLFEEYCQNCHSLNETYVGPALYPVTRNQSVVSFTQSASNQYHQSKYRNYEIPMTLSEHDLGLIYEYVKGRSVVAN